METVKPCKVTIGGLPLWFSKTVLPPQGCRLVSLVKELRSYMPGSTAKKIHKI